MYSVVLMMAMTTGGDVADIGGRRGGGGGGCCGCYGGGYGGGGCYGGGGRGGRRGGRRGGGGGGCCGCYGGGYGMGMGYGGCMGMGMGMGYGGCYGMGYGYGGCMGMVGGGCYGGGYGGGLMGHPIQGTQPEQIKKKPASGSGTTANPTSATIVVDLPAEAKLLVDNEPTTSTGDSRVLVSPALTLGKEYHYTLTAKLVRDGKTVKMERVITVRAGETTPVKFTVPAASVAQR